MTTKTIITVLPNLIEYRTPSGSGIRVVKIWGGLRPERISASVEIFGMDSEVIVQPMSLGFAEIQSYFVDAHRRAVTEQKKNCEAGLSLLTETVG